MTNHFGPCCSCGAADQSVGNILLIPHPAPIPGTGWGCVVCNLPENGALAVVCDACMEDNVPLQFVISGFPMAHGRIARELLSDERFEHRMEYHRGDMAAWN